jgi:hypothetical protein
MVIIGAGSMAVATRFCRKPAGAIPMIAAALRNDLGSYFRFWSNHRYPAYIPNPAATTLAMTPVANPIFDPSHQPAKLATPAASQPISARMVPRS